MLAAFARHPDRLASLLEEKDDAEAAYAKVIAEHPEDFRGYLAKGVFFREVGKPGEADNLFRQAKSLAPKEMADVVNVVVQQAKQQN